MENYSYIVGLRGIKVSKKEVDFEGNIKIFNSKQALLDNPSYSFLESRLKNWDDETSLLLIKFFSKNKKEVYKKGRKLSLTFLDCLRLMILIFFKRESFYKIKITGTESVSEPFLNIVVLEEKKEVYGEWNARELYSLKEGFRISEKFENNMKEIHITNLLKNIENKEYGRLFTALRWIGISQNSWQDTNYHTHLSFLMNMIALDTLLIVGKKSKAIELSDRYINLCNKFKEIIDEDKEMVQKAIYISYKLRNEIVHNGNFTLIGNEELRILDILTANALLNIAHNMNSETTYNDIFEKCIKEQNKNSVLAIPKKDNFKNTLESFIKKNERFSKNFERELKRKLKHE